MEDGAQADGTDNEFNAATTENGICRTSAFIHRDELERHFKGNKQALSEGRRICQAKKAKARQEWCWSQRFKGR